MKNTVCKTSSGCGQKVVGYVVLVLAVVLAFLTQSWEACTLGAFIVAAVLIKGKHHAVCNGCGAAPCCCPCVTNAHDVSCDMPVVVAAKKPRKATTKKAKA